MDLAYATALWLIKHTTSNTMTMVMTELTLSDSSERMLQLPGRHGHRW